MTSNTQPGRSCPLHYRYAPESLRRTPEFAAEILYVIGGLYGNRFALETILDMAASEKQPVTLVFNGDFNWFNVDDDGFAAVNNTVLAHQALRGNVETELAGDDETAGCGCAYPETVDDDDVERSNRMLMQLRATARKHPGLRQQLAALPMTAVAEVGGERIAIVHGDCESLAGWSYDESALRSTQGLETTAAHSIAAHARVIASSHTCLPISAQLETPGGPAALFNNGAAGMPNFAGTTFGVITRIAVTPAQGPQALYGTYLKGLHVDALAVHYDHAAWLRAFEANWPAESVASLSYRARILNGPRYGINRAMGKGIRINHNLLKSIKSAGNLQ